MQLSATINVDLGYSTSDLILISTVPEPEINVLFHKRVKGINHWHYYRISHVLTLKCVSFFVGYKQVLTQVF